MSLCLIILASFYTIKKTVRPKSGSKITCNTSSRNRRGSGVLLSRATATREAVQYLRNQAHLCVSAQQGRVSNSRSQARATSTCSHHKLTTQGHSETRLTFHFTNTACQRQPHAGSLWVLLQNSSCQADCHVPGKGLSITSDVDYSYPVTSNAPDNRTSDQTTATTLAT